MSDLDPDFDWQGCLERIRRGSDEDAAREMIIWLQPLVARIVRSHLPRRAAEEDLIQMILIKVFQNLHQYSGRVPLTHWVSRVAVNTCLKALRAEKSRPEWRWADLTDPERNALERAESATEAADAAEATGSRELVTRLLEALPPADRLVVQLLHLEERSIEEIKTLTGWTYAGVKVRAFRARQRMKKALKQLEKEELPWTRPMIRSLVC